MVLATKVNHNTVAFVVGVIVVVIKVIIKSIIAVIQIIAVSFTTNYINVPVHVVRQLSLENKEILV